MAIRSPPDLHSEDGDGVLDGDVLLEQRAAELFHLPACACRLGTRSA
jgi:hypothetical protein